MSKNKTVELGLGQDTVDGRIYDKKRDPPGQKSVYILPGNQASEVYRITTFGKYPDYVPVDPVLLARNGFTYTGYKDRVKCFSCGYTVHEWQSGDDPTDPKWHEVNCAMITGADCNNVPVEAFTIRKKIGFPSSYNSFTPGKFHNKNGSNDLSPTSSYENSISHNLASLHVSDLEKNREANFGSNMSIGQASSSGSSYQTAKPMASIRKTKNEDINFGTISLPEHRNLLDSLDLHDEKDRRKSFKNWPKTYLVSISDLARSGFFYLGNLDRTQCFSCEGVLRNWSPNDNVHNEHRRHFPTCRMVLGTETKNTKILVTVNEPVDPSPEEKSMLQRVFKLNNPINPQMRNYESRLQTFDQRWPSGKVNATVEQIAKAGFYFLGERDRAKCWYCNGGLQNWDPDDEPWTEHAKWFPGCEFVMLQKGIHLPRELYQKQPNLNRPNIRNHRTEFMPGVYERAVQNLPPMNCSGSSSLNHSVSQSQLQQVKADRQAGPFLVGATSRSSPPNALEAALNSEMVKQVNSMGFGKNKICKVIKSKMENGQTIFTSAEELLDALLNSSTGSEMEDSEEEDESIEISKEQSLNSALKRKDESGDQTQSSHGQSSSKKVKTSGEEQQDPELRNFVDQFLCKNCMTNEANMLLTPCGHISLCESCSKIEKRCKICSKKIDEAIKTFRA